MKGVLHCVSFALCEFPPDRIGHIWPSLLTVWLLWQLDCRARNHKRGLLNEEQTGNCHLLCSILYLGTASPQTRPKLPGPDLNLIWGQMRRPSVCRRKSQINHPSVRTALYTHSGVLIQYTLYTLFSRYRGPTPAVSPNCTNTPLVMSPQVLLLSGLPHRPILVSFGETLHIVYSIYNYYTVLK